MGSFRDKFSLSYLNPRTLEKTGSSSSLPGMEDALLTWGRRIVEVMDSAPSQSLRAFEIIDRLNARADVLFPVINYLASEGYLARLEQDSKGNDLFKLTDRGKKLLST